MSACEPWSGRLSPEGYGVVYAGGRQRYAHRLACERAHGPPPFPGACALHSCPEGDRRDCVNPAHLRWGTKRDNAADREARGRTRSPWPTKLGPTDVADMWALRAAGVTIAELARLFGVSAALVHLKLWGRWRAST